MGLNPVENAWDLYKVTINRLLSESSLCLLYYQRISSDLHQYAYFLPLVWKLSKHQGIGANKDAKI